MTTKESLSPGDQEIAAILERLPEDPERVQRRALDAETRREELREMVEAQVNTERTVREIFDSMPPDLQEQLLRELADDGGSERRRREDEEFWARDLAERTARARESRRKLEEWRGNFVLLYEVERTIAAETIDENSMRWMCSRIKAITETTGFEGWQDLRAAGWIAAADLHKRVGDRESERECLEYALSLNPKAPMKRRLKALTRELDSPGKKE